MKPVSSNQPDILRINDMVFQANHGCTEAEREVGATFSVDVELHFDQRRASETDRLEDTADVAEVHNIIKDVVLGSTYNLLETVAEKIAASLLDRLNIDSVHIILHKSRSPMPGPTGGYEVEIIRP